MKMYGVTDAQLHMFLTSALDRSEWSTSWPSRFTPREETQVPNG